MREAEGTPLKEFIVVQVNESNNRHVIKRLPTNLNVSANRMELGLILTFSIYFWKILTSYLDIKEKRPKAVHPEKGESESGNKTVILLFSYN